MLVAHVGKFNYLDLFRRVDVVALLPRGEGF